MHHAGHVHRQPGVAEKRGGDTRVEIRIPVVDAQPVHAARLEAARIEHEVELVREGRSGGGGGRDRGRGRHDLGELARVDRLHQALPRVRRQHRLAQRLQLDLLRHQVGFRLPRHAVCGARRAQRLVLLREYARREGLPRLHLQNAERRYEKLDAAVAVGAEAALPVQVHAQRVRLPDQQVARVEGKVEPPHRLPRVQQLLRGLVHLVRRGRPVARARVHPRVYHIQKLRVGVSNVPFLAVLRADVRRGRVVALGLQAPGLQVVRHPVDKLAVVAVLELRPVRVVPGHKLLHHLGREGFVVDPRDLGHVLQVLVEHQNRHHRDHRARHVHLPVHNHLAQRTLNLEAELGALRERGGRELDRREKQRLQRVAVQVHSALAVAVDADVVVPPGLQPRAVDLELAEVLAIVRQVLRLREGRGVLQQRRERVAGGRDFGRQREPRLRLEAGHEGRELRRQVHSGDPRDATGTLEGDHLPGRLLEVPVPRFDARRGRGVHHQLAPPRLVPAPARDQAQLPVLPGFHRRRVQRHRVDASLRVVADAGFLQLQLRVHRRDRSGGATLAGGAQVRRRVRVAPGRAVDLQLLVGRGVDHVCVVPDPVHVRVCARDFVAPPRDVGRRHVHELLRVARGEVGRGAVQVRADRVVLAHVKQRRVHRRGPLRGRHEGGGFRHQRRECRPQRAVAHLPRVEVRGVAPDLGQVQRRRRAADRADHRELLPELRRDYRVVRQRRARDVGAEFRVAERQRAVPAVQVHADLVPVSARQLARVHGGEVLVRGSGAGEHHRVRGGGAHAHVHAVAGVDVAVRFRREVNARGARDAVHAGEKDLLADGLDDPRRHDRHVQHVHLLEGVGEVLLVADAVVVHTDAVHHAVLERAGVHDAVPLPRLVQPLVRPRAPVAVCGHHARVGVVLAHPVQVHEVNANISRLPAEGGHVVDALVGLGENPTVEQTRNEGKKKVRTGVAVEKRVGSAVVKSGQVAVQIDAENVQLALVKRARVETQGPLVGGSAH
mmetsp:Transcript_11911/g.28852  ORF Transcript_11911/g.28852 Transcript_11911/m.28852 type:complete len:1006 (+) Transcript_11911:3414-6431(+)